MKTPELSCGFLGYVYDDSINYKVTLLIIATIMILLSLPTFLMNLCIIISIIRKPELQTPSFIVIINMAISDCLAGCSAYLFYATTCIRFAMGYDACSVAHIGTPWSYILGITSFNTIALQTIERYIAIFFPYWYHEKVSVRRVIIANSSTWISSIAMVTFLLTTKNSKIFHGIVASLSVNLFILTILCYIRVFREVRKIEKDMMTYQTASHEDRRKIKSESKVAKATLIILIAVIICFSPSLILDFYFAFIGKHTKSSSMGLYWTWLLALSNSFVNPLIACRQLTVLRRSVKRALQCFFPCYKPNDVSSFASSTSFALSRASETEFTTGKMRIDMK